MAPPLHLDGAEIRSEDAFHSAIACWSGFTGYGRNLDALDEILLAIVEPPIAIQWMNAAMSRSAIGPRFDKIVEVLHDAQAALGTDKFSLVIEQ